MEAGENLGFLPGTLEEKGDPYVRPLYDALFDMMDAERVHELAERGVIEIAPLAYMRGRTLNDAFVILDEAQNTTLMVSMGDRYKLIRPVPVARPRVRPVIRERMMDMSVLISNDAWSQWGTGTN